MPSRSHDSSDSSNVLLYWLAVLLRGTQRDIRGHERDREQRIEAIKRWIDYIKSKLPETWGPQQNAVVNDQLEAVQNVQTSASHRQHVTDVAKHVLEERTVPGERSK